MRHAQPGAAAGAGQHSTNPAGNGALPRQTDVAAPKPEQQVQLGMAHLTRRPAASAEAATFLLHLCTRTPGPAPRPFRPAAPVRSGAVPPLSSATVVSNATRRWPPAGCSSSYPPASSSTTTGTRRGPLLSAVSSTSSLAVRFLAAWRRRYASSCRLLAGAGALPMRPAANRQRLPLPLPALSGASAEKGRYGCLPGAVRAVLGALPPRLPGRSGCSASPAVLGGSPPLAAPTPLRWRSWTSREGGTSGCRSPSCWSRVAVRNVHPVAGASAQGGVTREAVGGSKVSGRSRRRRQLGGRQQPGDRPGRDCRYCRCSTAMSGRWRASRGRR